MKITILNPSKAYVTEATDEELSTLDRELTYTNTANQHLLKRHYQNHWWRNSNRATWDLALEDLKNSIHKTLVFEDEQGKFIRPGSISYLENALTLEVTNNIEYPTPRKMAWAKPLPFELYSYQEYSWPKLLDIKHGNVELCTGAGKTPILLKVCRETGFRTAIIAPSKSIFLELVDKFEHHFGKGNIGKFGNGTKKLGKRFTICIADSIANIKKDTPEWDFFSNLEMLAVDESHTWAAETLEAICYGVLFNVPYRLFFSGTQTRGDGAEKLLQSIIGKTVNTLTTSEAVKGGYISDHEFRIVTLESSDPNFASPDALVMKRMHFLGNKNIAAFIAKLANAEATTYRRQSLVLVEELSQIAMLLPLLKVPTTIAHSESNATRLTELGLIKVKPNESVEDFNRGDAMVLIGTSCIATGTNIFPVHNCVNWVGGASEIKTKQGAVGRAIRLGKHNPWADKCTQKTKSVIWDFNVFDCYVLEKHLESRIGYYNDSGTPIKFIKLK